MNSAENDFPPQVPRAPVTRLESFTKLDKIEDEAGWFKHKPMVKLARKNSIKVIHLPYASLYCMSYFHRSDV